MRSPGGASIPGLAIACALALAALVAGCGGEEPEPPAVDGTASPAAGGVLVWALPEVPGEVDPLLATSRGDQLLTRQIHEPLVETLSAPLGGVKRLPGLALTIDGSAGDTIWSFGLRPGVRFQDGSPLDAGAVVANGNRWLSTSQGQELMPDLFAVDAPRPDLVRFLLERPDPDFPDRLASPRTGIVSPRAFTERSGQDAQLRRDLGTGTGPFELREQDSRETLLARNLAWWGTERDLGPALDQVALRAVPDPGERLALLAAGDVQVADALGPAEVAEARAEPLIEVLPAGDGRGLGLERSVRGITSANEIPSLSEVWLTLVGSG